MIHKIALFASIILPLWNIPLVLRIINRKSSNDISLYWVVGVWFCLLFMFPSGIQSKDIVWKTFNIVNFIMFTIVLIFVLIFRKKDN